MTAKHTTIAALLCLSTLAVAGCGEKHEGGAAAPSAKPTAAAAAAGSVRDAKGRLTMAGLDAAWKAAFSANNVSDPVEKKMAAFEAKVGKPVKVVENTRLYWAYEGEDCYKVEIGKDGTKGTEKMAADKCEK